MDRAVSKALEIPNEAKEVGRGVEVVGGFIGALGSVVLGTMDILDEENRSVDSSKRLRLFGEISSFSSSSLLEISECSSSSS